MELKNAKYTQLILSNILPSDEFLSDSRMASPSCSISNTFLTFCLNRPASVIISYFTLTNSF